MNRRDSKLDKGFIVNRKGVALVTALLLTLISLSMVLAVIYLITRGTMSSAIHKRYQTALEASHGGSEIITKSFIPNTIGLSVAELQSDASKPWSILNIKSTFSSISMDFNSLLTASCLNDKLVRSSADWTNCAADNKTLLLKNAAGINVADMKFTLLGIPPQSDFDVYVKIVDTKRGNSNTSGIELEGLGVVDSGSGLIVPQHFPFMFRLEVQGERKDNPEERANLSVFYAY
jgi:hypothetical protein